MASSIKRVFDDWWVTMSGGKTITIMTGRRKRKAIINSSELNQIREEDLEVIRVKEGGGSSGGGSLAPIWTAPAEWLCSSSNFIGYEPLPNEVMDNASHSFVEAQFNSANGWLAANALIRATPYDMNYASGQKFVSFAMVVDSSHNNAQAWRFQVRLKTDLGSEVTRELRFDDDSTSHAWRSAHWVGEHLLNAPKVHIFCLEALTEQNFPGALTTIEFFQVETHTPFSIVDLKVTDTAQTIDDYLTRWNYQEPGNGEGEEGFIVDTNWPRVRFYRFNDESANPLLITERSGLLPRSADLEVNWDTATVYNVDPTPLGSALSYVRIDTGSHPQGSDLVLHSIAVRQGGEHSRSGNTEEEVILIRDLSYSLDDPPTTPYSIIPHDLLEQIGQVSKLGYPYSGRCVKVVPNPLPGVPDNHSIKIYFNDTNLLDRGEEYNPRFDYTKPLEVIIGWSCRVPEPYYPVAMFYRDNGLGAPVFVGSYASLVPTSPLDSRTPSEVRVETGGESTLRDAQIFFKHSEIPVGKQVHLRGIRVFAENEEGQKSYYFSVTEDPWFFDYEGTVSDIRQDLGFIIADAYGQDEEGTPGEFDRVDVRPYPYFIEKYLSVLEGTGIISSHHGVTLSFDWVLGDAVEIGTDVMYLRTLEVFDTQSTTIGFNEFVGPCFGELDYHPYDELSRVHRVRVTPEGQPLSRIRLAIQNELVPAGKTVKVHGVWMMGLDTDRHPNLSIVSGSNAGDGTIAAQQLVEGSMCNVVEFQFQETVEIEVYLTVLWDFVDAP